MTATPPENRHADIARLQRLWESLPNDDCDGCDGCGAKCAGDIPMAQWEFEQIQSLLLRRGSEPGSSTQASAAGPFAPPCRFRDSEAGRCLIYAVRPLICRLFGLVEWLPCPLGRLDAVLSNGVEIMRWYATLHPRPYEHWLQVGAHNAQEDATASSRRLELLCP